MFLQFGQSGLIERFELAAASEAALMSRRNWGRSWHAETSCKRKPIRPIANRAIENNGRLLRPAGLVQAESGVRFDSQIAMSIKLE